MHTNAYVGNSWNLPFASSTARNTTRNNASQMRRKHAFNVPTSLCEHWSLRSDTIPLGWTRRSPVPRATETKSLDHRRTIPCIAHAWLCLLAMWARLSLPASGRPQDVRYVVCVCEKARDILSALTPPMAPRHMLISATLAGTRLVRRVPGVELQELQCLNCLCVWSW